MRASKQAAKPAAHTHRIARPNFSSLRFSDDEQTPPHTHSKCCAFCQDSSSSKTQPHTQHAQMATPPVPRPSSMGAAAAGFSDQKKQPVVPVTRVLRTHSSAKL